MLQVNQRLVTAIVVADQDRLRTEPCNAVSRRLAASAKQQTMLIVRLTDDQNESEESLRVPSRLLLDEIVEDLSRSGSGKRN